LTPDPEPTPHKMTMHERMAASVDSVFRFQRLVSTGDPFYHSDGNHAETNEKHVKQIAQTIV
jgi:hypothetical protein